MNQAITLSDFILTSLLIAFMIGSRFNEWPQSQTYPKKDKPSDYIDRTRYFGFCFLYVFIFYILTFVLFTTPELTHFLPENWELPNTTSTLPLLSCAIIITALLAQPRIYRLDIMLRARLHEWARIPRAVEDLKQNILQSNCYTPTEDYINYAKNEIYRYDGAILQDNQTLNIWIKKLDEVAKVKHSHSIEWCYLKCLCLYMIVKDICPHLSSQDAKAYDARLTELRKIIQLSNDTNIKALQLREELDARSDNLITTICKYIVKKYPNEAEQYKAFKHFGFNMAHSDCTHMSIRDAIVACLLIVLIVSCLASFATISLLQYHNPTRFSIMEQFPRWTLGAIASFSIAITLGTLVAKSSFQRSRIGIYMYGLTFIASTFSCFIFFHISGDFDTDRAIPRFILAASFSAVTVTTILALSQSSHDRRDIVERAFYHGAVLALAMCVFQLGVSFAFNPPQSFQINQIIIHLTEDSNKRIWLGVIGFFKGLIVGGGISFILQDAQRKQHLEALRKSPRVDTSMIVTLTLPASGKELRATTQNISLNGALIRSREPISEGTTIELTAKKIGNLKAIVKWHKKRLWSSANVIGVEFCASGPDLKKYIRNQYGEFYA
ncbi:MAG: PilZ domain-containing protein [Pseudomonadales bacterium]|nr:PilZ domain-containing protein [Pseudomonadales bacterium]